MYEVIVLLQLYYMCDTLFFTDETARSFLSCTYSYTEAYL